jgi:hypothetical protein
MQTGEEIKLILKLLQTDIAKPDRIFFYGAGCGMKSLQDKMGAMLQAAFPQAMIQVNSDLLGAAIALLGRKPGLVGILGTGSNAGYFDGEKISQTRPSLGYLLGDEGSGAYMGKKMVTARLRNEMPVELANSFDSFTKLKQNELLQHVYDHPHPARWLASLFHFMVLNRSENFIQQVIESSLQDFFESMLLPNLNQVQKSVSFCGSVAFYCKEEIKRIAARYQLETGTITQSPMEGLVRFHSC